MKRIANYIIILSCIGLTIACTIDFIQKDIRKSLVNIVSPADNLNTPSNSVTFWWDELDGAETYNLQIVKPSFDSIVQVIIDTTIIPNKFTRTLLPGRYQWRIKAINGGGSTAFVTRNLFIDTTSNLNFLSVLLVAPGSNSVTTDNTITFSWNALVAATYYRVTITNGSGLVATSNNIPSTSYTYTFSTAAGTEEKIKWQVKAYNTYNNTVNDEIRSFRVDHKVPSAPTLSIPGNSLTVKDTTSFRWHYNGVYSDIFVDSVYVSTDSLFTTFNQITVPRTGTVNSLSILPYVSVPSGTTASSYYWWKVKSVDSVLNVSPASSTYKFKVIH